jgi:hypothetical protein
VLLICRVLRLGCRDLCSSVEQFGCAVALPLLHAPAVTASGEGVGVLAWAAEVFGDVEDYALRVCCASCEAESAAVVIPLQDGHRVVRHSLLSVMLSALRGVLCCVPVAGWCGRPFRSLGLWLPGLRVRDRLRSPGAGTPACCEHVGGRLALLVGIVIAGVGDDAARPAFGEGLAQR